jgi:hypothetical protein
MILIEPLEELTTLKGAVTNYRLNSSIHVTQSVSSSTGRPPFWKPSEDILARIAS